MKIFKNKKPSKFYTYHLNNIHLVEYLSDYYIDFSQNTDKNIMIA